MGAGDGVKEVSGIAVPILRSGAGRGAAFFFGTAFFFLGAALVFLAAAFRLGAAFRFIPDLRAEAFLAGLLAAFFLRGVAFFFAFFFAKSLPPFVPELRQEELQPAER